MKESAVYMLWSDKGETAVSTPQEVRVNDKWTLPPEEIPADPMGPRRRPVPHVRPSARPSVSAPHAGQSYNPLDTAHQDALAVAVRKLQKKKKADADFVRRMGLRSTSYRGDLNSDKNWENAEEGAGAKSSSSKTKQAKSAQSKKAEKKKKKKKAKKQDSRTIRKQRAPHRHPNRAVVASQLEEVDRIQAEVKAKVEKHNLRMERKKAARKDNTQIKKFGRHFHQPLALDVARSDQLVGALRHMTATCGGSCAHPVLDRVKSLEARNIIPARMRHTYNKRKVLKPKGDVIIQREGFGPSIEKPTK